MKRLINVFRIQWAMGCNRFLYWCKRIPLIKRALPDSLYAGTEGKTALMAVITVFKGICAFLGKFLYLFLACALPLCLNLEGVDAILAHGWDGFLSLLVVLSFFVGCFVQSDILSANLLKYTCVRQMRLNARVCLAATSGKNHVVLFLTFTPALVVAALVFQQSPLVGLLLSLELAATRLVAEVLLVFIFDKTEKLPASSTLYIALVVCLGLFLATLAAICGGSPVVGAVLLSPVGAAVLLLAGAGAFLWLFRYPRYHQLMIKTCRPERISSAAAKQNAAVAAFKDVQMKESDLKATPASAAIGQKKGYDYLNAIFFHRHRRLLVKPVKFQLIAIAVITVIGVVLCVFFRENVAEVLARLPLSLPFFVFIMYLSGNTTGMRICRGMFYNCDSSLLKFSWYRAPDVVLKNFTCRLGHVLKMNLSVSVPLCVAVLILLLASGAALPAGEVAVWMFAILCLSVFFSVHPLFMYYVFQPYSSELAMKNPFFTLLNMVVYFVCYLCVQIRQPIQGFAIIVLVATVVYCAVALLLVWRRAPKTFRVK